ncbi:large conductance mechanosensitive channel protein MscL [Aquimarina sp. ERC-38]|uniref:large conductance mechanosensitive channel protein MscL n=1 Tax=Aquimarina sp. ERC-38 TaxID=2949996 RepID=UPI00224618FA|nr:large conductance mechanosensitive channel protein MscL [Aquimarina sp. ERC-38]UZO82334.1 large conductance mechanosensitive channel protein MscL [Aquimarina sp. ERC-38]
MTFKLFKEFKDFAVKGNMIEIAIGVIIGSSFNKVVDVLVKEVFLPPLTLLTDGLTFEKKKWILREASIPGQNPEITEVAISYGKLIEVSLDFIIIGFVVFLVVKFMNSLKTKAQDPKDTTVKTPKDIELLDRVADLLEEQNRFLKNKG